MKMRLEPLEYAKIAYIRLEACAIASQQEDAVRWGLAGLERLGVPLSRSPGPHTVVAALVRMMWSYRSKARARLQNRVARFRVSEASRAGIPVEAARFAPTRAPLISGAWRSEDGASGPVSTGVGSSASCGPSCEQPFELCACPSSFELRAC